MIRQAALVLYLMGTVAASASDPAASRVDALIQEQEKTKAKNPTPTQGFVLGNTELRVDEKKDSSDTPSAQPSTAASQAVVTVVQPIHEDAVLSFSNEFGPQKSTGSPSSLSEDSSAISRRDIWALDWTRSNWNAKVYTENQGSGTTEQQLLSSRQAASGVKTGTKLSSGTDLSVELRQENDLLSSSGGVERNIYKTEVFQKLGSLPFILEVTPGLEKENDLNGDSLSHSTRLNNALRWQATTDTSLVFGTGVNSKDYLDSTREEALLYYSEFNTTFQKDITFSLRSDYQDLTRNITGTAAYQEQKVNIQIGPRFRLPENFTAALEMRYGYTQQNGSGNSGTPGETEQAVALSIQGKF